LANRAFFGVSPYNSGHRKESSSFYRPPAPTPQPPKVAFLSTPDRRPPPAQDANSVYQVTPTTAVGGPMIRRYFETDIPLAPYRTVINLIRGFAGGGAAPPPTNPPAPAFIDTAPRYSDRWQSGDAIFPPNFLQYDPLAVGAFITTQSPYQSQSQPYRVDSSVFRPPQQPSIDIVELRRFIADPASYQAPWRREGSATIQPPYTSFFFPVEVVRFLTGPPPWRSTPGYIVDVSTVRLPQGPDLPPPPPPTAQIKRTPMWDRRLKLLGIKWST